MFYVLLYLLSLQKAIKRKVATILISSIIPEA